ncbi:acyltransferase domain-containing protein [Micromonospora tulbaghiae]|uniref:acyltransferase domain-containing protein n=1 Tax=Micromonospora tulbaghiae TaxID=479978 RepID=UPI001FD54C11|nr:acyltransferase domain-containing protein [Micromonospora tulbaghiae]
MRAWVFPGQGSQHPGMGEGLLDRFPAECATAERIIGVPPAQLCRDVRGEYLGRTRYVQPAVFLVSVLAARAALADGRPPPEVVAGHSLGEYAALHLAGCLDFDSALSLVVRRGRLMESVTGGGMVAVLGLPLSRVTELLAGIPDVDLANHNLPDQFVLAGSAAGIRAVVDAVRRHGTGRCVPLAVSVPAHSRFMAGAAEAFAVALRDVAPAPPSIPVVSNVTGAPHAPGEIPGTLLRHFVEPVRWWDTMCLLARSGVTEPVEVGPGEVLTKMWRRAAGSLPAPAPDGPLARAAPVPPPTPPTPPTPATPVAPPVPSLVAPPVPHPPAAPPRSEPAARGPAPGPPPVAPGPASGPPPAAASRPRPAGSSGLRADYGIRYACLAGSSPFGVTSPAFLRRLSGAGLLGFFGAQGLTLPEIRAALAELRDVRRYGVAWPSGGDERALCDLYLAHDVRHVEVTGPLAVVSPQLVRFRHGDGPRQVMVRAPDLATAVRFLRPADPATVRALAAAGHLDGASAGAVAREAVATDVAVERDAHALVPALVALRGREAPGARIGVAGVGTPAAVAAAFALGADFVVTTTVNQCTVEAATSDAAKDLLAALDVTDVREAPDPDLFELGARSPVAHRGTLFAARAEELYRMFLRYDRLADVGPRRLAELERTHFGRPLDEVRADLGVAGRDDRGVLASVCAAYCREATAAALRGTPGQRLNYRVPASTDVGAFNRLVAAEPLADWRARHAELVTERLLSEAN